MLTIEHHPVKPGEAHDLDQYRVSRETLHTQRDLTVIDHFLDAVLLVHRSTSPSPGCGTGNANSTTEETSPARAGTQNAALGCGGSRRPQWGRALCLRRAAGLVRHSKTNRLTFATGHTEK